MSLWVQVAVQGRINGCRACYVSPYFKHSTTSFLPLPLRLHQTTAQRPATTTRLDCGRTPSPVFLRTAADLRTSSFRAATAVDYATFFTPPCATRPESWVPLPKSPRRRWTPSRLYNPMLSLPLPLVSQLIHCLLSPMMRPARDGHLQPS